jgi:hypothetical protein
MQLELYKLSKSRSLSVIANTNPWSEGDRRSSSSLQFLFSIGFEQEEDDASSPLSACCCYCRAIATLLDIPACSIRKEEMLHRSEMCISENREEMLLSLEKQLLI